MKFLVRDGFVVNYTERALQQINGAEQVVVREYSHYPGDDPFELNETQARDHAHKLEPAPKDTKAAEFLVSLHSDTSASVVAVGDGAQVDMAAIAAATAEATVAALVKAGVIKVPAAS